MEYLITPPEPTAWQIDEYDFIQHLSKQWSDIKIHYVTNSNDYYVLEWVIEASGLGQRLDGALHRDKQGISLDGYLEDCASFAIWFRSLVPQTQKLVFYDQGFNSHIELDREITDSVIMQSFLAHIESGY